MSLSPVSMNNCQKVYFKANDGETKASASQYAPDAPEEDTVELSTSSGKKNALKIAGGTLAGLVTLAAASYGGFKWKGAKWLQNSETGMMATIKKWVVKPGEFIENKIVQPIAKKLSRTPQAAPDAGTAAPNVGAEA